MSEKKTPQAVPPVVAELAEDATAFDEFAKQAAKTTVWRDAMKPVLPKKP